MKKAGYSIYKILWILTLLADPLAAGESGSVFQFLKINPDPESSALGNSRISVQGNSGSWYFNPALSADFALSSGLYIDTPDTLSQDGRNQQPSLKSVRVSASFIQYYQDLNYASLFGTFTLRKAGTFGIGVVSLFYRDDMPETLLDTDDNYVRTGTAVNAGDYALILNYARQLSRDLAGGINIKGVMEQLGDSEGKTLAADLGMAFKKDAWGIGLAVQNLGLPVTFREEAHNMPLDFELGAHYIMKHRKLLIKTKDRILFSGKIKCGLETEMIAGTGLEYIFQDILALRIGYQAGGNDRGFKTGAGIHVRNMSVDYGIHFHSDLGMVHRIGLSWKFETGRSAAGPDKDKIILKTSKRGLEVGLQSDVLFDYNRAELKPEACQKLTQLADMIKQYPDHLIRIEGNTDNTGTEEHNMNLSRSRAYSVYECLVGLGIEKGRLVPIGLGDKNPLVKNDTDENRQLNRRVDIILIKEEQQSGIGKAIINLPKSEREKIEKLFYFGLDSYYRDNKAEAIKYWKQITTENREIRDLIEAKIKRTEQEILNQKKK